MGKEMPVLAVVAGKLHKRREEAVESGKDLGNILERKVTWFLKK